MQNLYFGDCILTRRMADAQSDRSHQKKFMHRGVTTIHPPLPFVHATMTSNNSMNRMGKYAFDRRLSGMKLNRRSAPP